MRTQLKINVFKTGAEKKEDVNFIGQIEGVSGNVSSNSIETIAHHISCDVLNFLKGGGESVQIYAEPICHIEITKSKTCLFLPLTEDEQKVFNEFFNAFLKEFTINKG